MPTVVRRFDVGGLAAPVRLPSGWLRVDGTIARVGVQVYRRADGSEHRELRLPDEVFARDALASFGLVPVTNQHPPELLTAANARSFAVGSVGENVRRDGEYVAAPLMITDADAIAAVEAGRSQLSCGYSCELDETPGTHEGQRYDAVQRKIRGNHVALVDAARAGPGARVRLDAGDAVVLGSALHADQLAPPEISTMPTRLRIDGLDLDLSEANASVIAQALEREHAAAVAKFDAADKAKTAAEKARDEVQAKLDTASAALVELKAKIDAATNPATQRAAIVARVALESRASKVLGADMKLDALDDLAVKRAVIAKLAPTAKLDGQSDTYVLARYDAEIERLDSATAAPIDRARGAAVAAVPVSGARNDAATARAKMISDSLARSKPASA